MLRTLSLSTLLLALASGAFAVDPNDVRLLTDPAVSETHIAFVYDGDLWVAERTEGTHDARRITTQPGDETNPRFSPDGSLIAFSASYDGNQDVYIMPAGGGMPQRLTWHPGSDIVLDFTPDGQHVLVRSGRSVSTRRHQQLFTVPVEGGFPERLPIPFAWEASFSEDGSHLLYQLHRKAHLQWKNYRGGTQARLWIYNMETQAVEDIPKPEGGSNDTEPMWLGGKAVFTSDRDGEFNLYSFDPQSKAVERLTQHNDFPVLHATVGAGRVIYEQAGYLHLYDPTSGESERLVVRAASELREARPRFVGDMDYLRSAQASPSGARVVLGMRGEVISIPAEKGDIRNLTKSTGAHDRDPIWSPDGASIAYFSDASGEYDLWIEPQEGGEAKRHELGGAGFYFDPKWSPDGSKISFVDNSHTVFWIDLESGEVTKVGSHEVYGPASNPQHSWSPDGRYLAFTSLNETYIHRIHVMDTETGTEHPITDGLSDVSEPVFDPSGKYLYFFGSTDAGPVRTWFALSNSDMEMSHSLYLAVLSADEPSPLAPESDEEPTQEAKDDAEGDKKEKKDNDGDDGPAPVEIDFEGIDQRILSLPIESSTLRGLVAGMEGKVYFLRGELGQFFGPSSLVRFDLGEREETTLSEGVLAFSLSAKGDKLLVQRGSSLELGSASGGKFDGKKLGVDSVKVSIDPREEWRQIFEEVWRINRDYFYDPGMHGVDWDAQRERYAAFLPHVTHRDDLERVIRWMCSELGVGHHNTGGGDRLDEVERLPVGLLGADYAVDGERYRFTKVFGGLNWNPELTAPLTAPGVNVKAGEYLLAVAGEDLTTEDNLFARFANTAGKSLEITVGPNKDGSDSRTVRVVPIRNEGSLRIRDWVEGNLRRVNEASDGRVAYVWLPNTGSGGHTYFKRYFFPQAHKEAIIVDERFNGGGLVADYYIDILRRPYSSSWTTRYGQDINTPVGAIHGPKVMIIDETAGSGGDLLPWMFRKYELGPLVGKTTWGGLVGILGFPELMDGSRVTAPNIAFWTEEEGFGIENVGVPPDYEVEQWPAEVAAGKDPQLEKAIELVLEALEKNPEPEYQRPEFPIRGSAAFQQ